MRAAARGVLAAVLIALVGASGGAAQTLSTPVSQAKAGAVIVVRGGDFPAKASGYLSIGGVRATAIRTNGAGRFDARFRVPVARPGRRSLVALVTIPGTTNVRRAAIRFTVLPGLARVDHVVWIVMENKRYEQIIGSSDSPYVNALATRFGTATKMFAETHPSLRNYIAMTSGTIQDALADSGPPTVHPLDIDSIFGQLSGNWRALQESMPSNCALANSGTYAVRHNPATYYTRVREECATRNVPLADRPDLSARFTFITPNLCNDTHDCPVAVGDTWLSTFVPKVLESGEYASGRTVVFLTWDESDGTPENHIATIVIAPTTRNVVSNDVFNHYSLLRTTEELLGLPFLGGAARASSMRASFGL
jgi:phosphatidylinositol-3-phosphatase